MTHTKLAAVAIGIALTSTPRIIEAQGPSAGSIAATVTLTVGDEKEICAGANAVQPDAAKNGTWHTKPDEKDKALVHVLYKATAAGSETVTCGPDKKTFTINVATPTGADSPSDKAAVDAARSSGGFAPDAYAEAFKTLFLLFVLATVLESALAIVFNWRPFVEKFNSRAVKPVISLFFGLVFVYGFHLDLVTKLANLISAQKESLAVGPVLTAMVLAGGSAAVNNLMVALGFRQVRTAETVTPKPPATKGWISISVVRTAAIEGPVDVCIGVPDAAGSAPVVSRIEKSTRPGWRYFLNDPGRFPHSGGYAVASGTNVLVECSAAVPGGGPRKIQPWGPHIIADGAIIDLTFTM